MDNNTNNIDKDEQDWLDIVSGKPVPEDADSVTAQEARALRVNLKMREIDIPEPDGLPAVFDRLEAAGLLKPEIDVPGQAAVPGWRHALRRMIRSIPLPGFGGLSHLLAHWRHILTARINRDFPALSWKNFSMALTVMLAVSISWQVFIPLDTEEIQEEASGIVQRKSIAPYPIHYAHAQPQRLAEQLRQDLQGLKLQADLDRNGNTWLIDVPLPENISESRLEQLNSRLNKYLKTYRWNTEWQIPFGQDLLHIRVVRILEPGPDHVYEHFLPNPRKEAEKLKEDAIKLGADAKEIKALGDDRWRVDIVLPDTMSEPLRELIGDYNLNKVISASPHIHVEFVKSPD
ncbi:MAG: hypothetical protein GY862_23040 [Gammaproteobacteria bacterium]|nr:hypothetical protein [Gammaproteobacteria bacterium]